MEGSLKRTHAMPEEHDKQLLFDDRRSIFRRLYADEFRSEQAEGVLEFVAGNSVRNYCGRQAP
jgi:hypothetical protein